ncbi:hypothetical protein PU630_15240 [Microbacterium horticulturae]|uniref:Excreted virulence factor EspC, type VII ESX diderm n=1 Tax=Microbacterium horticulturae TaxID=3028316 RepID=A0ABY8C019_9MICO|nr:hypothetical protein [Microbacterium sp. KACC 23027]WEG08580.1 hypothetical protein PU630_15240 [Microbacterium sp. KACC 23027]
MSGTIAVQSATLTAGIQSLRTATDDFDAEVSRKNPDASDTGLAAPLLESALATVTQVALRLVFEVDTIADAAESGAAAMSDYDARAKTAIADLKVGG